MAKKIFSMFNLAIGFAGVYIGALGSIEVLNHYREGSAVHFEDFGILTISSGMCLASLGLENYNKKKYGDYR